MNKLHSYLRSEGLTQAVFADRLGVGRAYVGHIANGRRLPSLPLAVRIQRMTDGAVMPEDFIPANNGDTARSNQGISGE